MTDFAEMFLKGDGTPDRPKAFVIGLVGGVAGYLVAKVYADQIAPTLFGPAPVATGPSTAQAVGQMIYQRLYGDDTVNASLETVVQMAAAIAAGGVYGGSRTSTRSRDIAGSFFYAIRLWMGHLLLAQTTSLGPRPSTLSSRQNLRHLTAFEVYTFTMTTVTRLLYKALE